MINDTNPAGNSSNQEGPPPLNLLISPFPRQIVLNHPELHTRYLPHQALIHKTRAVTRVTLNVKPDPSEPSIMATIFDGEFSFKEITAKKWLERDLENMIASVSRKVNRTAPFQFVLKHALVFAVENAWNTQEGRFECTITETKVRGSDTTQRLLLDSASLSGTPEAARDLEATQFAALKAHLSTNSTETLQMIHLASPVSSVFRFIHAYCTVVLDRKEIFGTLYNAKIFYRYLLQYLKLGVHDKLPISRMVAQINLDDLPWLRRASPHNKEAFVAEFFLWFYRKVINVVINRIFYATTTNNRKNEVVFYRREIWNILWLKVIGEYIEKDTWKCLANSADPGSCLTERGYFKQAGKIQSVLYQVRLLPRERGLRPVMLRHKFHALIHHANPFDQIKRIRQARHILEYLIDHFSLRGPGQSSASHIQRSWATFRNYRLANKDTRPLYFVGVDIEKAYDSIDLDKLRALLNDLYQRCRREGLRFFLLYDLLAAAKERKEKVDLMGVRYKVVSKADYPAAKRGKEEKPMWVALEKVFEVMFYLAQPAVFKTHQGRWCTFKQGVPQGCPLSSQFLALYLGSLDAEMRISLLPEEIMMRFVDDMMFVTPYIHRGHAYLNLLLCGFSQLGLAVASSKTHTNLPDTDRYPLCSNAGMPIASWFGWLFDLQHLHLKVDLRRYFAYNLRYSITIDFGQVKTVRASVIATVNGKYAAALFDAQCVPFEIILQNIYEQFLITATELLVYWRRSPLICRRKHLVLRTLVSVTKRLCERLEVKVRNAMQHLSVEKMNEYCRCMAWMAYCSILTSKRAVSVLGDGCRREILRKFLDLFREVENYGGDQGRFLVDFFTSQEKRIPLELEEFQL